MKFNFRKVGSAAAAVAFSATMLSGLSSSYQYTSQARPILETEVAALAANDQGTSRVWTANSVDSVKNQIEADWQTAEDGLYTIRWGDTLWAISQATGVSVWDLATANGIADPNFIVEGWMIEVRPEVVAELLANGQVLARNNDTIDRSGQNRVMITQPTDQAYVQAASQPSSSIIAVEVEIDEDADLAQLTDDDVEVTVLPQGDAPTTTPTTPTPAPTTDDQDDQIQDLPETPAQDEADDLGQEEKQTPTDDSIQEEGETPTDDVQDQEQGEPTVTDTEVIEEEIVEEDSSDDASDGLPADQEQREELSSSSSQGQSDFETPAAAPAEKEEVPAADDADTPVADDADTPTAEADDKDVQETPAEVVREVVKRTDTITIKAGIDYVENPDLEKGTRRVVSEGEDGQRQVVYEDHYENGELVQSVEVSNQVTKEAKNQVVEVGTKEKTQPITKKIERDTVTQKHGVRYQDDSSLPLGEKKTIQEGQDRIEEVTYEVSYQAGEEVGRQETERRVVQEGQDQIIAVGRKVISEKEEGVTVPKTTYAVQHGDTINSIARKFGVKVSDISNANGSRPDASNLRSGQTLVVRNAQAKPYKPTQTDRRFLIYLDVGHGGGDPGGGGNVYGLIEKNANLNMANKIKNELSKYDMPEVDVYMNRTNDKAISLANRSIEANQMNADLFVSVHHNAMGRKNAAQGIENYYYEYSTGYPSKYNKNHHNNAQRLVNSSYITHLIHDNLIGATGAVNRGVQTNTFAVLREAKMPAVLLELGFMDHYSEAQKLKNQNYQNKMADAVARGIVEYYGNVYNNGRIPTKKR